MAVVVEKAHVDDLPAVLQILERQRLPLDGLTDHLATTVVAREGRAVVGSAALEIYPDGALLRSVAVTPGREHQGLGGALTLAALRLARDLRVPAVFLLTTTADRYFPRFGFARIDRTDVPPGVQSSVEFTAACPSSAVVMRTFL